MPHARVRPAAPGRGAGGLAAAHRRPDGPFLIGLFCGVFGNGPAYRQLTHGIFDDIFRDLGPAGDLHFQRGHTMTVYYNEVVLGRWLEQTIRSLGVRAVLGTVLQQVDIKDSRISKIELASRYGNVMVKAEGFVDASGDAALTWQARLAPALEPRETAAEVLLECDGIGKDYGGLSVLDGVTLTRPARGLFGLCGPNGAGKPVTEL